MKAYIFPGQGAQFAGMGKNLYNSSSVAKGLFEQANEILGFRISDIMFSGTEEDIKQTKVTQPAIFLHSTILTHILGEKFKPDMVAGHSLGEFSSLVANKSLFFEDGLILVSKRAEAMQKACEAEPSTMAAVIGLEENIVQAVCNGIDEIVIPANYNSPGQIVISGSVKGVELAVHELEKQGAKRIIKLMVGGAFHSPFMESAKVELEEAIRNTKFSIPFCPVYQNATALPSTNPEDIKNNLVAQLTSPVMWTQTVKNMLKDGATSFIEVGPGKVLQGLVKKVDPSVPVGSAEI
jgi:[acyl-carrier-protein] S-malonyltransferase